MNVAWEDPENHEDGVRVSLNPFERKSIEKVLEMDKKEKIGEEEVQVLDGYTPVLEKGDAKNNKDFDFNEEDGEFDEDGFYRFNDGSGFYDPDGHWFNEEGVDDNGGYYEEGIYVDPNEPVAEEEDEEEEEEKKVEEKKGGDIDSDDDFEVGTV